LSVSLCCAPLRIQIASSASIGQALCWPPQTPWIADREWFLRHMWQRAVFVCTRIRSSSRDASILSRTTASSTVSRSGRPPWDPVGVIKKRQWPWPTVRSEGLEAMQARDKEPRLSLPPRGSALEDRSYEGGVVKTHVEQAESVTHAYGACYTASNFFTTFSVRLTRAQKSGIYRKVC
jgi:hypothetical protein